MSTSKFNFISTSFTSKYTFLVVESIAEGIRTMAFEIGSVIFGPARRLTSFRSIMITAAAIFIIIIMRTSRFAGNYIIVVSDL